VIFRSLWCGTFSAIWLLLIVFSVVIHPLAADEPQADVRIIPIEEEKPVPGSVRISSGQILGGMISSATTLAPLPVSRRVVDKIDQKLALRVISQGYRDIYVPRRRAEQRLLFVRLLGLGHSHTDHRGHLSGAGSIDLK